MVGQNALYFFYALKRKKESVIQLPKLNFPKFNSYILTFEEETSFEKNKVSMQLIPIFVAQFQQNSQVISKMHPYFHTQSECVNYQLLKESIRSLFGVNIPPTRLRQLCFLKDSKLLSIHQPFPSINKLVHLPHLFVDNQTSKHLYEWNLVQALPAAQLLIMTTHFFYQQIKMITKILKTNSEQRTQKQCIELLEQIGNLQFFKTYNQNPATANVPKLCCKYMEIEIIPENSIIFDFGSIGNKFYVVLQGNVGIWVPNPKEEKEEKPKNKANQAPNFFNDFKKVKDLNEGTSFGELALLSNNPRLATARTETQSYLATLSKENFIRILKEHEEHKLRDEIQFLMSVPAFSDLNNKQIRYLCLNNKIINTLKNEVIYDEKDDCNGIHIIKSGEFEIYKGVEQKFDQKEEQLRQNILSFSSLNKHQSQKAFKFIKVKVLTAGEMVGEELLLKKKNRDFRLVCSSPTGVIVRIKETDFLRKISEDIAIKDAFFNRLQHLKNENEQRIEKRVEQFLEFRHFLVEDRIPAKIKHSIGKMYSNSHLSDEQKQQGIAQFREKYIAATSEEMQVKNEFQSPILSSTAVSQRFSNANSAMFQNQLQYLQYKRLSIIAAEPMIASPRLEQQQIPNTNRRTSILSSIPSIPMIPEVQAGKQSSIHIEKSRENLKQLSSISLISSQNQQELTPKMNESKNLEFNQQKKVTINFPNLSQQGDKSNMSIHTRKNQDHPKIVIDSFSTNPAIRVLSSPNETQTPTNSESKNVRIQEGVSMFRQKNSDIFDGQTQSVIEKNPHSFESPPYSNRTRNLKSTPKQNESIGSQTEYLSNNKDISDSQNNSIPQLFLFGNETKKIVPKKPSLSKDNFIRSWKKQIPQFSLDGGKYEDAQKVALLRRIKKITSVNEKNSPYFNKNELTTIMPLQPKLQEQEQPQFPIGRKGYSFFETPTTEKHHPHFNSISLPKFPDQQPITVLPLFELKKLPITQQRKSQDSVEVKIGTLSASQLSIHKKPTPIRPQVV